MKFHESHSEFFAHRLLALPSSKRSLCGPFRTLLPDLILDFFAWPCFRFFPLSCSQVFPESCRGQSSFCGVPSCGAVAKLQAKACETNESPNLAKRVQTCATSLKKQKQKFRLLFARGKVLRGALHMKVRRKSLDRLLTVYDRLWTTLSASWHDLDCGSPVQDLQSQGCLSFCLARSGGIRFLYLSLFLPYLFCKSFQFRIHKSSSPLFPPFYRIARSAGMALAVKSASGVGKAFQGQTWPDNEAFWDHGKLQSCTFKLVASCTSKSKKPMSSCFAWRSKVTHLYIPARMQIATISTWTSMTFDDNWWQLWPVWRTQDNSTQIIIRPARNSWENVISLCTVKDNECEKSIISTKDSISFLRLGLFEGWTGSMFLASSAWQPGANSAV